MRVLLPVDGSDSSNGTLKWAAEMLNRSAVSFYLLSVISDEVLAEYKLEDAMRVLDEARRFLQGNGFSVEKAEYTTGDPLDRICQYAEDKNVDQIMVGSHGRSGLAKIFLGSVSEGLLKHSPKPVFIYRATQDQMAQNPL